MNTRAFLVGALCAGSIPSTVLAQENEIDLSDLQNYGFASCEFSGDVEIFVISWGADNRSVKIVSHPEFDIVDQEDTLTMTSDGVVYQFGDETAVRIEDAEASYGKCQDINSPILDALTDLVGDTRMQFDDPLPAEVKKLRADLQAETERATSAMVQAETRAALLSTARKELREETERADQAVRQTELLNQQVAVFRSQLAQMQALLDDAEEREQAQEEQLQSLGQDLNQALARAAAEERRRRELEEDTREDQPN